MNDKAGGTPDPFNVGMHAGNSFRPQPSMPSSSPSNFGARPAPSAPPVQPLSGGPAEIGQKPGTLSGKPAGMSVEEFTSIPGPAEMGRKESEKTPKATETSTSETNTIAQPQTITSASPMSRPMTKAAQTTPVMKKKSNKPLIIGLACGAGVLLIGAVVAVLVAMSNQPDPVAEAMKKLVSTGLPEYVEVSGDINIQGDDDTALVSHKKVALQSSLNPSTLTNETHVTVTMGGKTMEDTTFQVDEIYAGAKDLYFKFDGVDTAIDDYFYAKEVAAKNQHTEGDKWLEEQEDECVDEEGEVVACSDLEDEEATDESDGSTDETDADTVEAGGSVTIEEEELTYNDMLLQIVMAMSQVANGQWVQMNLDEQAELSEQAETNTEELEITDEGEIEATNLTSEQMITELVANPDNIIDLIAGSRTSCTVNLFGTLRNNLSTVTEYYRSNPFLGGTRREVTLASTSYPVYRLVFDQDNYDAFVTNLQNKGLLADYLKCAGETMSDVMTLPSRLPAIYTEVDSELNFTRFYFATDANGQTMNVNIALSYPTNINVKQPVEYTGFWDVLQKALSGEGLEEGATVEEDTTSGA